MKTNNEKMEEMRNKYGIEKMNNFADIILEIMIATGDKAAKTIRLRQDINELIRENIMEKILLPNLDDEEITDKVHDFFMQIKLETENFIKEIEEKKV